MWFLIVTLGLFVPLGCNKAPRTESQDSAMQAGLDALYTRHDPAAAAVQFRHVLALNPNHYGATFQLASALDQMHKEAEAKPYWKRMLVLAEASHDEATANIARARLGQRPPAKNPADAAMQAGVDALYAKHDPQAAVVAFTKVLELDPNHRGAHFHLALALEEAGEMDKARAQWRKVLALAESAQDKPIADTARAHLAKIP